MAEFFGTNNDVICVILILEFSENSAMGRFAQEWLNFGALRARMVKSWGASRKNGFNNVGASRKNGRKNHSLKEEWENLRRKRRGCPFLLQ